MKEAADKKQGDGHLNDSECHRCLAVSFNPKTNRVGFGLSGQFKKVKVHPSIWGKSLVSGRPRSTCAEFRVINEAVSLGEKCGELQMYVADVMTGKPKPRCRNCLYLSQDAQVFSDSLVFDGNMTKMKR